jgi:hypothetical protein
MPAFDDIAMYWRFMWGLREFLKKPLTGDECREIICQRLKNREPNFMATMRRTVYDNPSSPYLKLLTLTGCEYGDVERMVRADGIEGTLTTLKRNGVFLSYEEFKRGKEVVRGSTTFRFDERDFDNPFTAGQITNSSGGTRSAGTRTTYEFNYITNMAVYVNFYLSAYHATRLPVFLWMPIMPGVGPRKLLEFYKVGITPTRFFSPVNNKTVRPSLKNRLATQYIIYAGRLFGADFPAPEYVPMDESWRIAECVAGAVEQYDGCSVKGPASLMVRICQAARERGLNIAGTKFLTGGEPLTEGKAREISSLNVDILPQYAFTEAGYVGFGCLNPGVADDLHVFKDSVALIQAPRAVTHASEAVGAFLFTSLLMSAPKILLNVEPGDYGVIERSNCGCEWEKLGLTEHIHTIRGFDKLTGEGMTFIGTDFVRIIEEVLPAKFGGASTDYQMLEEEDEASHTRMSVVASPKLGSLDEAEVIRTVLGELGKGRDNQRMMAEIWSKAGTLRVKRMLPFTTSAGKLMPLHIKKTNRTGPSAG